jgi:hypothetical protein
MPSARKVATSAQTVRSADTAITGRATTVASASADWSIHAGMRIARPVGSITVTEPPSPRARVRTASFSPWSAWKA